MKNIRERGHMLKTTSLASALVMSIFCAAAAENPSTLDRIHLSNDIVPAPDGFEPVAGKFVVAKSTDVYISPFIWAGKVTGLHLNAGQPVQVLAKLKGYDWLLIGMMNEGMGYVPISILTAAR
jgi:hypothetical protein